MNLRHFISLLGIMLLSLTIQAAPPQYVVTPVAYFNGSGSNYFDIHGINNSGQVSITGGYFDSSGSGHGSAYRWDAGSTTYLGSLGGGNSGVGGINNKGEVVGASRNSAGYDHAFLWSNGTMQDLGRDDSYGSAVNYSGQVAGSAYFGVFNTYQRAALYSGGVWTSLGTLGGNTSAGNGINSSGQVAGKADTSAANTHHAFLYSGGSMTDLGTLGGTNSEARGINDAGILVGNAQVANGETHAFIYYGGAMHDLGILGGTSSSATAINQAGMIVGNLSSAGFLQSGGVMYDLNNVTPAAQGVTSLSAASYGNAINDWGQIAAYGYVSNNPGVYQQAVILTPRAMGTQFSGGLGDLAGGTFNSGGNGVSNGGSVVVGFGSNSLATSTAFRWSSNGGMIDFANNSSNRGANAAGVSADGLTIVGYDNNVGVQSAFRYTSGGGLVQLGNISGGTASYGLATSSDGAVVVGRADSAAGVQPFRWTQSGGMVGLGWLAGAGSLNAQGYGVSGDGSVVVGYSKSANSGSNNEAFRWTQSGGMVGLGDLAGGIFNSTANGVSSDGLVIVGQGTTASGSEAFRWTQAGGMVSLGDFAGGATGSNANAVSGNGKIVVGSGTDAVGSKAFVWDVKNGMRNLQSVLSGEYGVDFTGWTLTDARGISAKGDSIAGTATDPLGNTQAYSAQINSRTNRFVSGETYNGFHTSVLGGNGSSLDLLAGTAGGTAGSFRTVTADFVNGVTAGTTGVVGDIASVTGTGGDLVVIQMSYDSTLAPQGAKLGWFNGATWVRAVDGNTGGAAVAVSGAYDGNAALGRFGVDTVNHVVWAVVNSTGQFAAIAATLPVVATTAPTNIAATTTTLNGTVNPNGLTTTAQFQYGLTTSYGSTASVTLSPGNGSSAQNVSAALTALAANTLYHYRLAATNVDGTASTMDGAFITQIDPSVVNFTTATTVPFTVNGFTATGLTLGTITLGFAPTPGTNLTMVNNTGLGFISGTFSNLAQGQTVALTYNGVTYNFVANYYGGTGNDLVLVWQGTRAFAWGDNRFGQLGDNSTTQRNSPAPVTATGVLAGKTVISVAAGQYHSMALCSDGTVAAWGYNFYAQLGDGPRTTSTPYGKLVPGAVNTASGVSALFGKAVVAVSAGLYHSLALCSDGTVAAWGENSNGQLGDNSTTLRKVPVAVNTASGVSALFGKTVVALAAGGIYNVVLCSDGTVAAWGYNYNGELGDGTTTTSSPAGKLVPVAVSTASGVSALFGKTVVALAGADHSVALCSDGTVAAWGYNGNGQLGDNSTIDRPVPVAVNNTPLAAGERFTGLFKGSQSDYTLALVAGSQPAATTLAATAITSTGATLNGTVNANNNSTAVSFDYGTSPAYGTTVAGTPTSVTGSTNTATSATLTGLTPGTMYHFRVNGTSVDGTAHGPDLTFTTLTPSENWRLTYFATTANTGNAADSADPNGNGIKNLLEYALGGDPAGTTTGRGILPQVAKSAGNTLQISFTRFLDRTDLTLTVYAADALAGPWTALSRSTGGGTFTVLVAGATAPETGAGNTRSVTVTDLYLMTDPAHPQRFMKLEAAN